MKGQEKKRGTKTVHAMKNKVILIITVLGLSTTACVTEVSPSFPVNGEVVFYASNEEGAPVKTVLQGNGSIKWNPSDRINLFYGSSSFEFSSTNSEPASKVEFHGTLDGIEYTDTGEFWAVYPYDADNTFTGSSVTVSLSAVQKAVAGSFDDDLFISMAKTKDYNLQFYNVCGGVKFSVTTPGVKQVTFKGNNGEAIAGGAEVSFDANGKPVVLSIINPETEISLSPGNGSSFEVGEWYYFVCFPSILSSGYTLHLVGQDGTVADKTGNNQVVIKRSVWGKLEESDKDLAYVMPSDEIWYTSTDGQKIIPTRTYNWKVKIISNTIEDGRGVIKFNGPVTAIPEYAFYNNSSSGSCLKSLRMPNSVTTISPYAFYQCNALESIELSDQLERIDSYAFYSCFSLHEIVIPESVIRIGVDAFSYCVSLSAITILGPARDFGDDRGMAFFLPGSYVREIKNQSATEDGRYLIYDNKLLFVAGKDLGDAVIPEGVTEIAPYVFRDFYDINTVSIPSTVSTIDYCAFMRCNKMKYIFMNPVTPPVLSNSNEFDGTNDCAIVVPSGSVESYKSAWPQYELRIGDGIDSIPENLSASGRANCYMVNKAGKYRFNVEYKGNSTYEDNQTYTSNTSVHPEVLWESTVTIIYEQSYFEHDSGILITDIGFSDGQVFFTATGNEGNALIALKNSAGTVLWSWHIWFVNEVVSGVETPSGKVLMDRNIGALKKENEWSSYYKVPVRTYGLLYQLGRKDPFVGGDSSLWSKNDGTGSYTDATKNPTVLYGSEEYDYWSGSSTSWYSSSKGMNDPSPPGWMVSNKTAYSGTWSYKGDDGCSFTPPFEDYSDYIQDYYYEGSLVPNAGYIHVGSSGASYNGGGQYYSADQYFTFSNEYESSYFYIYGSQKLSHACSVRCMKQ